MAASTMEDAARGTGSRDAAEGDSWEHRAGGQAMNHVPSREIA